MNIYDNYDGNDKSDATFMVDRFVEDLQMKERLSPKLKALAAAGLIGLSSLGAVSCAQPNTVPVETEVESDDENDNIDDEEKSEDDGILSDEQIEDEVENDLSSGEDNETDYRNEISEEGEIVDDVDTSEEENETSEGNEFVGEDEDETSVNEELGEDEDEYDNAVGEDDFEEESSVDDKTPSDEQDEAPSKDPITPIIEFEDGQERFTVEELFTENGSIEINLSEKSEEGWWFEPDEEYIRPSILKPEIKNDNIIYISEGNIEDPDNYISELSGFAYYGREAQKQHFIIFKSDVDQLCEKYGLNSDEAWKALGDALQDNWGY